MQAGNADVTYYSITPDMVAMHIFLLLNWVLIIFKRKEWKYVFLLFLFIGLTPFVDCFNPGIYWSIFGLTFDPILLTLLIIHLTTNPTVKIGRFFKSNDSDKKGNLNPKLILKFETKFADKSNAQLEHISSSHDFSPEAQAAAKKLLDIKIEE